MVIKLGQFETMQKKKQTNKQNESDELQDLPDVK